MLIYQLLKDNILELTLERVAHLENVVLKETMANAVFTKHLETQLRSALRGSGLKEGS